MQGFGLRISSFGLFRKSPPAAGLSAASGVIQACAVVFALCACSDAEQRGSNGGGKVVEQQPPPTATPAPGGSVPTPQKSGPAYQIAVTTERTQLKANQEGTPSEAYCTEVSAVVLLDSKTQPGVEVVFSLSGEAGGGKLLTEKGETDEEGGVRTGFCSGPNEGRVVVKVGAGSAEANSAPILIDAVSVFKFEYYNPTKSKAPPSSSTSSAPASAGSSSSAGPSGEKEAEKSESAKSGSESESDSGTGSSDTIYLNLLGAGEDCTVLTFVLEQDGVPLKGEKATFRTQDDLPVGTKLAYVAAPGEFRTDPSSGKKYAFYEARADARGVFQVPVCAGVVPGSVMIFAEYAAADLVEPLRATSPLIVFNTGLPNLGYLSLTLDPETTNISKGFFNTNAEQKMGFVARLGATRNADVDVLNPLGVMAEIGKVILQGDGRPSKEGRVTFSYEAVNVGGRAPYQVDPSFDIRCDPLKFATQTPYTQLAHNWRSNLVYYVRGQEYFHDANSNGVYDEGGDGFWDKNQNGIYDAGIDELTHDAGTPGFDINGEWFIDLPSPFVDSNGNGEFDPFEPILGEQYVEPNGKWDANTTIWKHLDIPVFMGSSVYSLTHSQIYNITDDYAVSQGLLDYISYLDRIKLGIPVGRVGYNIENWAEDVFPKPVVLPSGGTELTAWRYFLAQDVCGNPLPGGSEITVNVVNKSSVPFGERDFRAHIYMQAADKIREPARHLLLEGNGSSTAKFGYDVSDHPAATASYPIEVQLVASECSNFCSGVLIDNAPEVRRCPAQSAAMMLTVQGTTIGTPITVPSVGNCSTLCRQVGAGAPAGTQPAFLDPSNPSVCICSEGYTADLLGCVPPPPEDPAP